MGPAAEVVPGTPRARHAHFAVRVDLNCGAGPGAGAEELQGVDAREQQRRRDEIGGEPEPTGEEVGSYMTVMMLEGLKPRHPR